MARRRTGRDSRRAPDHGPAGKTNQDGAPDVRFVKNGAARALLAIRPDDAAPDGSVFDLSGQSIGRRFSAVAKRAGYRATAHSARLRPLDADTPGERVAPG